MFAIAGIVLTLLYALARPEALVVQGFALPLSSLFVALGLFGLAIDLKLRKSQLILAPQLGWAVALAAWLALTGPADVALPFALFVLIAQGVQRFSALATVAVTLLAVALALAMRALAHGGDDLAEPTIALALALPSAVALFERKRSAARGLLLLLTLALAGRCVTLTQSRGAVIVFLTGLTIWSVTYDRARGLVVAALAAAVLLRFGRAGAIGALPRYDVVALIFAGAMIYVSLKIVVVVLRDYREDGDAAVARTWARASAASLAGAAATLVFVPVRHDLLPWIYVGLAGALYQATRAHDPKLHVALGKRDLLRLALLDVGILALGCL